MTLIVHAWGAYRSYKEPVHWRPEDYQVNLMVKVAKGTPTRSEQHIRCVDGAVYRVSEPNGALGRMIFGKWAAARLKALGITDALVVPVPSSSHVHFDENFAGSMLAQAICDHSGGLNLEAAPVLAFSQVMPKASRNEAGSRNEYILRAALKVSRSTSVSGRVAILVDDVVTLGGHIRACASLLRDLGAEVEHAFYVGRTVIEEHAMPLALQPEDIEPGNPFDF